MISFVKKPNSPSFSGKAEENRFEQIRKAAADKRGKPEGAATRRRDHQKAEDDRLL